MSRIAAVFAFGLVWCLVGLSSSASANQTGQGQNVSIEYRIPKGFQYSFQQYYQSSSMLNLSGGGQSGTVQQDIQTRVSGSATVVRVRNGKPSQVRLRFAPASGTQVFINGQADPQPFALAGQEVVVTIQNDRVTGIVSANGETIPLDDTMRDFVSPAVVFPAAMRPGRPVGVGSQWQARVPPSSGSGRTDLTVTLRGFETRGNRRVALLQGQGSVNNSANGMSLTGPVSVMIAVDVETGLPIDTTGTANVRMNGAMDQNGQSFQINGPGRIGSRVQFALSGQGVQQQARQQPQQQRPRAAAPKGAGPANRASKLVGAFRGESIASSAAGGSKAYVNTQLWWVFQRDGTVLYGAKTHFTANKRDYNQDLEWTAHGNTGKDVDRGRWQTQGKILSIQWENGNTTRVAYSFEPDGALVFRNARTGKLINFFPRVR